MTKREGRRLNQDIDRQLKRAALRPMAEPWPPDPVVLGPFGIRHHVWGVGFVLGMVVSGLLVSLLWWLA